MNDVFLDLNQKSKQEKEKIFKKAYSFCFEWWVDILDCQISSFRKRIKSWLSAFYPKRVRSCRRRHRGNS